jgi:CheY-like chemotaxis protein
MSAPQSNKGTILVADDNEANRELLSALLSPEGYQVVCVLAHPAAPPPGQVASLNTGSP